MAVKVVLDTDIGTDVDDCLALGVLLGSPEIDLIGVTCVYGDVLLRARMVRKLLQLGGRGDIPVYAGVQPPLLGVKPVYWPGHEGVGLLEAEDDTLAPEPEHAIDYLIRTVMDNPGEIHLLAIGPLTNIAMAIRREPRLFDRLAGFTIMGGVFRGPGQFHLPYAEHNIICDPESAQIVFGTGVRCRLIPLDVTLQVAIRRGQTEAIRAGGPLGNAIATQVELYPRFAEHGSTALHDPLAALAIVDPSVMSWESMQVEVETSGRIGTAQTLGRFVAGESNPVEVALSVDIERAEAGIRERLIAASRNA